MLTDLRQDLAYALRLFRRSPGFAAIAILTLALGMGATTTIFTLANWALLRPVPGVTDPAQRVGDLGRPVPATGLVQRLDACRIPNLADVSRAAADRDARRLSGLRRSGGRRRPGGAQPRHAVRDLVVLRRARRAHADRPSVHRGRRHAAVAVPRRGDQRSPVAVDVPAETGRPRADARHRRRARSRSSASPRRGFTAPSGCRPPTSGCPVRASRSSATCRRCATTRATAAGFYELVARLKPGATWAAAQAETRVAARVAARTVSAGQRASSAPTGFHVMGPIGPHPLGRTMMQRVVGSTAFGASALVLLIACANVAGLLTDQGTRPPSRDRRPQGARRRARAPAAAAPRRRSAALDRRRRRRARTAPAPAADRSTSRRSWAWARIDMAPPIDWRVLAFTGAVSLVVGVMFSVDPGDPRDAHGGGRDDAATAHDGDQPPIRRHVARRLSAGRGAHPARRRVPARRHAAAPGGRAARLRRHADCTSSSCSRRRSATDEAESLAYVDEFQRRLRRCPASSPSAPAARRRFSAAATRRRGSSRRTPTPQARPFDVDYNYVLDGAYFSTLAHSADPRPRLHRRRARGGPPRRGARRHAVGRTRAPAVRDADPIGRAVEFPSRPARISASRSSASSARRATAAWSSRAEDVVYEPAPPNAARRDVVMIVRAAGGVRVAEEARRIATALNPALPLTLVRSMEESIGRVRARVGFAGAAARHPRRRWRRCWRASASTASSRTASRERRREFGIRAALGASRGDVWRLVLRQSATIIGAGLALGLAGAYAFAQVLSARLVGVSPLDPALWSARGGARSSSWPRLASLKPALAATRVDVSETLRAL